MFLIYCIGIFIALALNVTHLRAFALRLFYAIVIVSAHYDFAPVGAHFYLECGEAQFLILIAALAIRCEAAIPIAGLALVAVLVNLLAYVNFPSHDGIWVYYYALINTIQTCQIVCLLTVSPVTIPWIRKLLNKNTRNGPWMLRLLEI